MTLTARQIGDLLTTHGLRPSRALGQNFVIDPNTVRRIVRLADIAPGDRVLEVGPGLGSLTVALADTGAAVTAVEIDDRLIPVLEAVLGAAPVRVVRGDALRMDWTNLLGTEPGWVLVANLPYNIATPLIATVLDEVPVVSRLVVMVQREVAERLVAHPGRHEYGAVSVKVAYWAESEVVGHVPPTVFVPRPKVESTLVAIRRRAQPAVDPDTASPEMIFRLVRAGFAKRRKMLRRSLAGLVPAGAFEAAEVHPESRAEDLDVYAWGRLARAVAAAGSPAVSAGGPGSGGADAGGADAGGAETGAAAVAGAAAGPDATEPGAAAGADPDATGSDAADTGAAADAGAAAGPDATVDVAASADSVAGAGSDPTPDPPASADAVADAEDRRSALAHPER